MPMREPFNLANEEMKIETSTMSDPGTKNRQPVNWETPAYVINGVRMEDHGEIKKKGKVCFVCVADGHGSVAHMPTVHLGGKEAAVLATQTAIANMDSKPETIFNLAQAALKSNSLALTSSGSSTEQINGYVVVNKTSPRQSSIYSMHGCTLSCLSVTAKRYKCSWVGDSSVLLYRRSEKQASWVTTNHDIKREGDVKRVLALGGSRYGKSYLKFALPDKEEYMFQMTRSLGHFGNNAISHVPSIVEGMVEPGDTFVVATDGLWKYVSMDEVTEILAGSESVDDANVKLKEKAKRNRPQNRDNVYIVVVKIPDKEYRSSFGFMRNWLKG